jgi:hypothetical protein
MTLGTADQGCPDGWLRCRRLGRQKEEEEPRPREAAGYCSGRRNRDWDRNKRNKRPRPQGGNSGSCPVHPNSRHSAVECHEIIKLVKRVSERRKQTSKDGFPHLIVGPARRGPTTVMWLRETETSGISHSRETGT